MIEAARPNLLKMLSDYLLHHAWSLSLFTLYLLGAAIVVYYGWLEPPPFNYGGLEPQSRLIKDTFYPGEALENVTTRCNMLSNELTYTTSRRIIRIDAEQPPYILESVVTTAEPGCWPGRSARNKAPMLPGVYQIRGTAVVPGTWRTNYVNWHTGEFTVIPLPPGKEPQ